MHGCVDHQDGRRRLPAKIVERMNLDATAKSLLLQVFSPRAIFRIEREVKPNVNAGRRSLS
jgi:hypothetical protein